MSYSIIMKDAKLQIITSEISLLMEWTLNLSFIKPNCIVIFTVGNYNHQL